MAIISTKDFKITRINTDQGKKVKIVSRLQPVPVKTIKKEDKKTIINKTWEWFYEKGHIDSNFCEDKVFKNIDNVWKDQPCYVIGSGPPLKTFLDKYGWSFFDDKHTIGINHIIEDYDKLEWMFFLDKRFLDVTTYDLDKFKGRVFAQNTTGLAQSENVTLYKTVLDKPSLNIADGLYSSNFSGLAALNLALLTGANPIYLIGFGMGTTGGVENYHYKESDYAYNKDTRAAKRYEKYKETYLHFKQFMPYVHKIKHVTNGDDLELFSKIKIDDFEAVKKKNKEPNIVHLSFTDDINLMGEISREIINNCYGNHSLHKFGDPLPNADLYILEHFLSTQKQCQDFPYKKKAIDIVHTVNCIPKKKYAKIVCVTDSWRTVLNKHNVKEVQTIKGGIDLEPYKNIFPEYGNNVFGRITRWSPGKVHPEWNTIVNEILTELPESKCHIYTKLDNKKRTTLNHDRMIYDGSVNISDFKGTPLRKLSVYVHCNGSFKDTMSHAVIEAMATGLPIIFLKEGTGVLCEVTGSAGVPCNNIQEVKQNIIKFLKNKELQIEYGKRAKEQAKKWSSKRMLQEWDKLIREVLNEK